LLNSSFKTKKFIDGKNLMGRGTKKLKDQYFDGKRCGLFERAILSGGD
jgi:hypothetical protein